MTININLKHTDLLLPQLYLMIRSKLLWGILGIGWIALFISSFRTLIKDTGEDFPICTFCALFATFLVSTIVFIAFLFVFFSFIVVVAPISTLIMGQMKGVLGEHLFTLMEDGVLEKTAVNETLSEWTTIRSLTKKKRFILIRVSYACYYILPRKRFVDQTTYDQFWESLFNQWADNRS